MVGGGEGNEIGAVEGVRVGEAGVGAAVDVTVGATVCALVGGGDGAFGGNNVETWVRAVVGARVWELDGADI